MREYDPQRDYDARKPTKFTKPELERLLGYKGVLPLTGRFVEVKESNAGPFMVFQIDERWGFDPDTRFGMDLDAFKGIEE